MVGHAVEYAGETIARPDDGEPDDDLQHDDRGRRPRRDDRPRRDHLRVGRGPPGRARGLRRGGRRAGASCRPTTAPSFDTEVEVDAAVALADGHLGHEPGPGGRGHRRGARAAERRREERALALHGRSSPARAMQRDRARPRLHRLLHELADRRPARGRRDGRGPQGRRHAERDGRPGLGAGQGRRPRRRASTRSSAPPASTGAAPAARCAWG